MNDYDDYWLDATDTKMTITCPSGPLIEASLEQIAYMAHFGGVNNSFLRYYFTPTLFPEDITESLSGDNDFLTARRDLKYVRLSATFINPLSDETNRNPNVTGT